MAMRRAAAERDVDEEMRLHLELREAQLVSAGRSPAEAHDEARRRFGALVRLREDSVDAWGWRGLDHLRQDVRFGVRSLRRSLGFTTAVVLSLGVGIGVATAIFSLVNAVFLKSLPAKHPDE